MDQGIEHFKVHRENQKAKNGRDGKASSEVTLVDKNLSDEGGLAAEQVRLATIEPLPRRLCALFLEDEEYGKVQKVMTVLQSRIMMECLPTFAHSRRGEIVRANRLGDRCNGALNPSYASVRVNGQTRIMLAEGYFFIRFPSERVVISIEERNDTFIEVRSNGDASAFWDDWKAYTKVHAYLRNQAFFADGEIIERTRNYGWDSIHLSAKVKRLVKTHVEDFLDNRDRLKRLGVKGRRGLILAGEPGTGKTLLGKVLANTVKSTFIWVSPRHIRNPSSFMEILSTARALAPSIVFLEDLDLFGEDREGHGWMGLGELMNQLDGAVDNEDIIIIATTNHVAVIEKALRNRPGRFDRIVEFEAMDRECRHKMLKRLLAKADISPQDFDYLAASCEDFTGAQVEELANTVYILAVSGEKEVEGQTAPAPAEDERPIPVDRRLIDAALAEIVTERKTKMGFQVA